MVFGDKSCEFSQFRNFSNRQACGSRTAGGRIHVWASGRRLYVAAGHRGQGSGYHGKGLSWKAKRELALLGLKIKKRADRPSTEKPNTVIEQLPKSGETVKTGQMILVVTSKQAVGDETPTTIKKSTDEDDTEKIEEMITDKPKKPKANSNANHKKADTTRDVNDNSNSNSNSNSADSNSNKKENGTSNNSTEKPNKNTQTPPNRVPATNKPATEPKPKPKQP